MLKIVIEIKRNGINSIRMDFKDFFIIINLNQMNYENKNKNKNRKLNKSAK